MGRFTLPVHQKIISLLFFFFTLPSPWAYGAREIEGVKIPETMKCEGKEVPLSGAGLRTATFLKVKVFVLAVYAEKKILKGNDGTLAQRPVCFDITYLREFDNEDVDKAWDFQFKESSDHDYPTLKADVETLKSYFGKIKGDKKESLSLIEGTTKIYENGEFKGVINGGDFQKSFLSLWYGPKPPTEELQNSLLK